MTARIRSRVSLASLALPFQMRQRRRSTSATITALAFSRSGVSAGRMPAVFSACCSRMAMWNQSRLGDTGIDQDRAQPGTAIGERRQPGVGGLANLLQTTLDQRFDRRIGLCDRGETLPAAVRRLDIAKANFEMPLALLTAPNEGRIQGQGDRRGCDRRLN